MSASSKVDNVRKNILAGTMGRVVTFVAGFACRSVFIYTLGMSYLGVSGLFSNILQVLSLAELGFGTAIVYRMYKPIEDGDTDLLAALTTYYQKIYRNIAILIAVFGLLLVPFLPYAVNMEHSLPHLTLYYLLYLTNTVVSYLFIYKTTIVTANQKAYVLNIYTMVSTIAMNLAQVILLLCFHNFILYLVVQIVFNLVTNALKARKAEEMYPFINQHRELSTGMRKDLITDVKSLFVVKVSAVILNNTDNILISVMLGTVWVGLFSNYMLIVETVSQFVGVLSTSISATIGSINATNDTAKHRSIFEKTNFILWWAYTFCAVCFLVLFQDFFALWSMLVGKNISLNYLILVSIVLNFYTLGVLVPVSTFSDSNGMFRQTKFISLLTAVLNIILSIVFGHIMGLAGILFATSISRLPTNMLYRPYILYTRFFHTSAKAYFLHESLQWVVAIGVAVLTCVVASLLHFSPVVNLVLKGILCACIPNVIIFAIFRKSENFQYVQSLVNKLLKLDTLKKS